MRTLKFLLQKEFRQIFRDPSILRMIFIMPVIQLLLLPLAADYEIKNIRLAVVDHDHSTFSNEMIRKITASGYFILTGIGDRFSDAQLLVEEDKADIVLEIPNAFEKDLVKEGNAALLLSVNAINGVRANLGAAYLGTILRDFNNDVRLKWIQFQTPQSITFIEILSSNWYNNHMNYKLFMVPGILVVLLTMVGSFMTALNIVKEKEIGTIEQINVTPVKKYHFILGKLIPFWILGIIVLTLGLAVSRIAYGIIPIGNIALIYLFAGCFLLAVLGLGLLVSTYAQTQQQAMLIAFFLLMIFILMSGLYTSVDSMPEWAQVITWFNPVKYFIEVMRMVVMKGSGFNDIKHNLFIILIFAVVLNTWAILNYRKQN